MPAPVHVCLTYAAEDFVNPNSDDAELRLAELHTRLGLPATFKVVGEKARRLRHRGRSDVIAAMARHDIGYHTDLHSVPPTLTEYCEALPWHEGKALFRQRETRGLHDVQQIFGRPVRSFGKAGRAWAPQMYPVLREWGIRAVDDAGPFASPHGGAFWLMGLLHAQRLDHTRAEFNLQVEGDEIDGALRFDGLVKQLQNDGGGVISMNFHPWEWTANVFWDDLNFAGGASPPLDALTLAPAAGGMEVERRFAAMERYLGHIARNSVQFVTAGGLCQLYPDRAGSSYVNRDLLLDATADWDEAVSFVELPYGWLSAAELLTAVAGLLATDDTGLPPLAPERVTRPTAADGPLADVPPLRDSIEVAFGDLVDAASFVLAYCAPGFEVPGEEAAPQKVRSDLLPLPSGVPVGRRIVQPQEFLLGAVRALRTAASSGSTPYEVTLSPTWLTPAQYVRHELDTFNWPIFPEGFDAPQVIEHARRQAWTLKPAVLSGRPHGDPVPR